MEEGELGHLDRDQYHQIYCLVECMHTQFMNTHTHYHKVTLEPQRH